ncbi:TPA: hypothetical protein ACSTNG_001397 [Serratia fonticola]
MTKPTLFFEAALLVLEKYESERAKVINILSHENYSKVKGIEVTAAFKLEDLASAAKYCGADKDAALIKEAAFSLRNCLSLPIPFYIRGSY